MISQITCGLVLVIALLATPKAQGQHINMESVTGLEYKKEAEFEKDSQDNHLANLNIRRPIPTKEGAYLPRHSLAYTI